MTPDADAEAEAQRRRWRKLARKRAQAEAFMEADARRDAATYLQYPPGCLPHLIGGEPVPEPEPGEDPEIARRAGLRAELLDLADEVGTERVRRYIAVKVASRDNNRTWRALLALLDDRPGLGARAGRLAKDIDYMRRQLRARPERVA